MKSKDDIINPNNRIINRPKYKIHGLERRKLKKKLSIIKSLLNTNPFYIDCLDNKEEVDYENKLSCEIERLEKILSEPYTQTHRDNLLNELFDDS